MKYYSVKKILQENCDYNIIIGERSNGKTYALLKHILECYIKESSEGAYIRRWNDDIVGKRAENVFNALEANGEIGKITKGKYSRVIFSRSGWHLANFDEKVNRMKADKNAFCHAFSLTGYEHDKSTSYPNIRNIVFDEFLTRNMYLRDEFIIFMNVLSTIIRDRTDVKIFMLGNTVNKYAPYFAEMGLRNVETQEQGTIDVYTFANKLKIAVEYCGNATGKKSNKYFSFANARLNMITSGKWEIAIYPHLPAHYSINRNDILFTFFIRFGSKLIGCDIVQKNNDYFIFCRWQTKETSDNDLEYSLSYLPSPYKRKSFLYPIDDTDRKIKNFFSSNRVFYLNNEIGEIVHNYLLAQVANT